MKTPAKWPKINFPSRPTIPSTTRIPFASCPLPEQPKNGRIYKQNLNCKEDYVDCKEEIPRGVTSLQAGDQIVFNCDEGYAVSGGQSNITTCTSVGKWSHIPKCEGNFWLLFRPFIFFLLCESLRKYSTCFLLYGKFLQNFRKCDALGRSEPFKE